MCGLYLLYILINIQDLNALDFFSAEKVLKALRMLSKGLLFREPPAFVIFFEYFDFRKKCSILRSAVFVELSRLSVNVSC